MHYNLRGKISNATPFHVDATLTEAGSAAEARAVGEALAKKADKANNGTVISENADYAEVGWWLDGNPNNADRTGYFVCIADDVHGTGMRIANSTSDVRGVVVTKPAFSGNATEEKFDENGQLLPKYDYVGIMGFVSVIDDGSCVVNGRCMPNDDGIATASSNNLGYHVIERVDSRHVLIAIEPNGDMVQRIKTEIEEARTEIEEVRSEVDGVRTEIEEVLSEKVDKEQGKTLTSNDFTDEYKAKLDDMNEFTDEEKAKLEGIEAGANKFVLEDKSVTPEKLDRAYLTKEDTMGSPFVDRRDGELTASDIGSFLRGGYNSAVQYTLTQAFSTTLPIGTEIAVFRYSTGTATAKIIASGVRWAVPGQTEFLSGKTLSVADTLGTVILKKLYNNASQGDLWTVMGNVEVL